MSNGQHKSLIGRIIESWRASGQPNTREALHQNPDMRDKGMIMDLVLAEYKIRRDSGEQLAVTRFCDQFSTFRDELRELLHVENGISNIEQKQQVLWPQPGETFLEFSLQSVLGVGAAARVYLARQTTLGNRLVALKVTPFGSSEAQTLGKLRHRNVVPVLSIHDDPERQLWAVCMPYLGSATLLDVRNHAFAGNRVPSSAELILEAAARDADSVKVPLDPAPRVLRKGKYYEGVAFIGAELAEGLAHTHSQGVLHRDLKPSNVLIASDGCPMLLDFNLAWDAQRESFRLGGTVPYMPPEQLYATFLAEKDEQISDDPRSDVFSLGVILFELLTGRLPFAVDEHADLSDTIDELMRRQLSGAPNVRDLVPAVPRGLARLIHQCLLVEVSGRPYPKELADELRRVGIRPRLRGKRSPVIVAAIVSTAASLVLTTAFSLNLFSNRPQANVNSSSRVHDSVIDTREEHLQLAVELLEREEFATAAMHFDMADKLEHHWTVAAHLAYCYCRSDQFMPAYAVYVNLVKEKQDDAGILNNYAQTLIQKGNYVLAREFLDQALSIDPELPQALFNRATLNLKLPDDQLDPDVGVQWISRAAQRFETPAATLHIGAAHLISKAFERGALDETEYRRLLEIQLKAAVAANCPRSFIATQPSFQIFSNEPWFAELIDSATATEVPPAPFLYFCEPPKLFQ